MKLFKNKSKERGLDTQPYKKKFKPKVNKEFWRG